MRKKIALLAGQVQEQYQTEFIHGFMKKAFSYDYDVVVFSTYERTAESDADGAGEVQVFSVIHYEDFEGIVLLPDTLRTKGLMLKLEKQLREYKGKVLYVDKESRDYPFIFQDNARPIYRLTEHLIKEHGYQRIGFLNGGPQHSHSIEREKGFRQCMQDYGLPVKSDWVFYGDYWYYSAERVALQLLEDRQNLPEAMVCANDYMAVGLAGILEKNGIRIPEDMAIVGFDSVEAGQKAPQPITSIPLSSYSYGDYAMECMLCLLKGQEFPVFAVEEPMFVGSSCGCSQKNLETTSLVRKQWRADEADIHYYMRMKSLTEELVLQTSFHGLMDSAQTYTYQIREFALFTICLNEGWMYTEEDIMKTMEEEGYSENMLQILKCGRSGEGADRLDYTQTFPRQIMLPELQDEWEKPRAFFVTPLSFEANAFGYAVISYDEEGRCIDDNYCMWLRSFVVGLEVYQRNEMLRQAKGAVATKEILDSLTSMFNYDGFIKHARPMIERGKSEYMCISILALDISGLDTINNKFGRREGDQAIKALSKIIFSAAGEGAMCCRLGNDEFIIAELTKEANHDLIHAVSRKIYAGLEQYNHKSDREYSIKIHSGDATANVDDLSSMEDLVNQAVSNKNGNKMSEQKMQALVNLTPEEEEKLELVKKILDENLFHYHFQPIVNAKDGSIYAYEALMRSATETFVSPLDIIRFATHLNRLKDVERATFFNITNLVLKEKEAFAGKKVFINSIPGHQLEGEEAALISTKLKSLSKHIVVELTEQTMADDETLNYMKKRFEMLGIETAVDDYGTGYSNIVNLLRYMPNYVKIDRMLLSGIQENHQKQHFVKDIVLFAQENDFKVLAEGVETLEELQTVIRLGVDLIQGYYTAKPNPTILQSIDRKIMREIREIS